MANAYLPAALDDYADAALPLERLKHRRFVVQIRPTECEWPEFHGHHVCRDATGKWRERHAYWVETRKGRTCAYCGRHRPGGSHSLERIIG